MEAKEIDRESAIYVKVPIEKNKLAKSLGLYWDADKKSWFINKWIQDNVPNRVELIYKHFSINTFEREETEVKLEDGDIILNVPFDNKEDAKNRGAFWCNSLKLWIVKKYLQKKNPENYNYLVNTYDF